MAEGRRHAVVFETARWVHAFVLQEQSAGRDADVSGHAFGRVKESLAFAHGDALLKRNKGQQFVEPPHAAEAMRVGAPGPFFFEAVQRFWHRQAIPIVDHVDQIAAFGAVNPNFIDAVRCTAGGYNTLLIGGGGF